MRPLNDGNERIAVVEIDCLPRPICLINCYMPTFGYSDTSEKFQDNLDLPEIIIQKYCESHQIILVGDMNATLVTSRINDSDKRFRDFVQRNKCITSATMGDSPTYQHEIGSSQIDYFLARSENLVKNLIISDRDTCNTSSHVLVCCTLNCEIYQVKTTTELPTSQRRLLWKYSNTELYRTTL